VLFVLALPLFEPQTLVMELFNVVLYSVYTAVPRSVSAFGDIHTYPNAFKQK